VLAVLVLLAVPFLILAGTAFAVWSAAHTDDARKVEHADVIIVLGAAQYAGDPSPAFRGRLQHAAILYDQGRADDVLVIGGGAAGDATTEAEAGQAYLVDQEGLPAEHVHAVPEGSTTMESLEGAARYMDERDLDSAFLVSDPWHNLRARRMASDLGIEAYVSATWHSGFTTEESRLSGYTRETFAYLYYRLFGR
jgi:vancomycin permeability regulator SanA